MFIHPKTRNIFRNGDSLVIGDLGISKLKENATKSSTKFFGTPEYMSPKILNYQKDKFDKTLEFKHDIW